jgi:hypothetical protein
MPTDVTATLRTVLHELEAEKEHLDRQIGAVRSALDGAVPSPTRNVARQGGQRRSMTAAEVGAGATTSRPRRRRRMSAAARAAVGRRMKAYWAKRRAAKAKGRGTAKKGK